MEYKYYVKISPRVDDFHNRLPYICHAMHADHNMPSKPTGNNTIHVFSMQSRDQTGVCLKKCIEDHIMDDRFTVTVQ